MRAALAALALLCALASPAPAQPPAARRLAEEGAAARKAGKLEAARGAFERAYRQTPSPRLLFDLGMVARAQGRAVAAADLLRRALAEAAEELTAAEQEEARRVLLEPLGPSAEVVVSGDAGALLLVDDHVAGALPLALPLLLPAGPHRLRLESGGRRVETRVEIKANRPAELRFTLVPPIAVLTPTAAALLLADLDGVPEGLRGRVGRAASEAAARERVLLLPSERLAALLQAAPELGRCLDRRDCQERLAERVEAQYVVALRAAVDLQTERPALPQGQGAWRFAVEIYDVAAGDVGASGEGSCGRCSLTEASQRLAQLTASVVGRATTRPRGHLEVASRPPGAAVSLDGRAVGATPLRRAAFVGPHELLLERAGYEPHRAAVEVSDGQVARIEVTLRKAAAAAAAPAPPRLPTEAARPTPIYRRWWFWTLIGVGAAGVVAGSVAGAYYGVPPARIFRNPIFLQF